MRMIQREQELAAAGVHIEDAHIGAEVFQDDIAVAPRERGFFVSAVNMGEIPSADAGDFLLAEPGLKEGRFAHIQYAFLKTEGCLWDAGLH